MLRLATDENFNNIILRGLLRIYPELDVVRVQDTALYQADDLRVLDWTAQEGRLLLTHDVNTMPGFVYQRIREGKLMRGVFVIHDDAPVSPVIEDLLIIIGASTLEEWDNSVNFLPFPRRAG